MRISTADVFTHLFLLLALLVVVSCSDWTDQKTVDTDPQHAKEQNPELWTRYTETLRTYRQNKHSVTYGSFDNSVEKSKNEGDYLRSSPDSLDIVTPTHPENLTSYDCEDILLLQERNIKMLYLVDYTAQVPALVDAAKLDAWLNRTVTATFQLGVNGFAIKGIPLCGGTEAEQAACREATKLVVSKLSTAVGDGKLLVLEDDPIFMSTADLNKLDYVALDTTTIAPAVDLKLYVAGVIENFSIPKEKLLLSAKINEKLVDEEGEKLGATTEITNRVVSLGPVGRLVIYALGDDYYHTKMNYETSRLTIQIMNLSK